MPRHALPLHVRLVDVFAVRDYAYLVSAILMLAGAFRLMQIPVASEDLFRHTLFVFAILAVYELLILGATVLVMRALRIPDQARLLSLIALSLALDPTFFNQSLATFHNLGNDWGLIINLVLLGLLPVKAWIIWRFSNAPFSPRLLAAYLLAGSLVYLSPLLFLGRDSLSSRSQCFAVLVWAPLVIAWCTPSRKKEIPARETFLTTLTLIASGIVLLHLFNIGNVYLETVSLGKFHPRKYPGLFIIAPIVLTSNLLQLQLKTAWEGAINHRQWLAIGPAFAVLCGPFSPEQYHISLGDLTLSPLHLTVLAGMLILWRASRIPGCRYYGWAALLLGLLGTLGPNLDAMSEALENRAFLLPGIYVWVILVILALRRPRLVFVLPAVEVAVWGILHQFGGMSPTVTFQIMGWAALLTVLVWRRGWESLATTISLIMFLQIFLTLVPSPEVDASTQAYAWLFAVIIAAGSLRSDIRFVRPIGLLPLLSLMGRVAWPLGKKVAGLISTWLSTAYRLAVDLPPGFILVLLAFLIFGMAIVFSFRRASLATWVREKERKAPPPDEVTTQQPDQVKGPA